MMDVAPSRLQRTPESEVATPQCRSAEANQVRAYARELVAQAPPLSAERRARLAALLCVPATARPSVSGVA